MIFKAWLGKYSRPYLVLSLFFILACILMGVDAIRNPDAVSKVIKISSRELLVIFIILNLALRIFLGIRLPKLIRDINRATILPVTTSLAVILAIVGYLTYENFVFNRLLLNYQQLGFFALGSLAVLIVNTSSAFLKKNYQYLIFISAPILLFSFFIIRLWPMDAFLKLVAEDNLVENCQFLILIVSSMLSFYVSYNLVKINKILAILFFMVAVMIFFVAGDEISWGQRIFNLKTPQTIAEKNVQDELNIHNLDLLHQLVGYAYILVGFYGAISWVITKHLNLGKTSTFSWITPPWFLFFYFFTGFAYNFSVLVLGWIGYGEWSEVAELMLYLGTLLFIVVVLKKLIKKDY